MQAIHSPILLLPFLFCLWIGLHFQYLHFCNIGALLSNFKIRILSEWFALKSEYRRISEVDTLLSNNGFLITIAFTKKYFQFKYCVPKIPKENNSLEFHSEHRPCNILYENHNSKPNLHVYVICFLELSKKEKVKTFLPCHHYWSAGPGVDLAQSQEDCQCCCCKSWF